MWPLSRRAKPKQHLSLVASRSMLAETVSRCVEVDTGLDIAAVTLICGAGHEQDAIRETGMGGGEYPIYSHRTDWSKHRRCSRIGSFGNLED